MVHQITDSIYFDIQSIDVLNNAPLTRVRKGDRDSIQIKTIAFPKSRYKIAHSQSVTKNYFDFSINTLNFQDPLKHIDNISFKYLLGELEIEAGGDGVHRQIWGINGFEIVQTGIYGVIHKLFGARSAAM